MTTPTALDIATMMRQQLDVIRASCIEAPSTEGLCALASILVSTGVRKFAKLPAKIRGGSGADEGFRDVAGQWHGHYWVEAGDPTDPHRLVIDITADQFGSAPLLVAPFSEVGSNYRAGDQALVDSHIARIERWLADPSMDMP